MEQYKSLLDKVAPEHKFYCNDGKSFGNLKEAEQGLKDMHPDTFSHHVNPERNDLSNWVRHVYGDHKLADNLMRAKDPKSARKIIQSGIISVSQASTSKSVKNGERTTHRKIRRESVKKERRLNVKKSVKSKTGGIKPIVHKKSLITTRYLSSKDVSKEYLLSIGIVVLTAIISIIVMLSLR